MILCPYCKSDNWKLIYRDPLIPAEDEFQCCVCGALFYRYEETEYERPGDKKHK